MSKWLVIGSSLTAPLFLDHLRATEVFDVVITTNAGILLEPTPTYYLVHDPVACMMFAEYRNTAREQGTLVVKSKWAGEATDDRMRGLRYDIAIGADRPKYSTTKKPDSFTPGRYLSCGASGALCLQFAVNNGARTVTVVGMEGYNSNQTNVHIETFDGRKGHTRQYDRTQRQYMPFMQSVIDTCQDISFRWFGVPNFPLVAPNLKVFGSSVLPGRMRDDAETLYHDRVAATEEAREAARLVAEKAARIKARRQNMHGPIRVMA